MQEQKASARASLITRFGVKNTIWTALCATLLLVAAILWLVPYASLPTASWRDFHHGLPWKSPTLRVNKVDACWKSSAGHKRMELRAAYYPTVAIELGVSQGSGLLNVRFTTGTGVQLGDTINLHYKDGAFMQREEVNIRTEGNKAELFVEAGYERTTDFHLHVLDEASPLWRVNLFNRAEGESEMQLLGSVTIPAKAV